MFTVTTPTAAVLVQSGDENGGHPYFVDIRDGNGILLGAGSTIPGAGYADWEDEIAQLYKVAREKALGIDEAFTRLAADLGLPPDPGASPF